MPFSKITEDDMRGKGNVGKPDTPGVSTSEMQRIMDELPREVIAPKFNKLIDDMKLTTGAAEIGAAAPAGATGKTVQEVLNSIQTTQSTGLTKHLTDFENPHKVTAAQTGAYTSARTEERLTEVAEQATAEVAAAELRSAEALVDHVDNKSNPHGVTAAQLNAYTKEETNTAIDDKIQAIGAGDMSKAEYGGSAPGIVKNADNAIDAEKLNGKADTDFLDVTTYQGSATGIVKKADDAVDSEKLGGKLPSEYLAANGTAVDSLKLGGKLPSELGVNMDVLWENSAPGSSMPERTIDIPDTSAYQLLLVEFNASDKEFYKNYLTLTPTAYSVSSVSRFVPTILYMRMDGVDPFQVFRRGVLSVSSTSIKFSTGYYVESKGTPAVRPDLAIPCRIYGIK